MLRGRSRDPRRAPSGMRIVSPTPRRAYRSALGLAEDEPEIEAGARGVAAAVLLIGLVAVPQIVGVVLGVEAHRLGERRLGTAGVPVSTVIGLFFLLTTVAQLVLA